MAKVNKDFQGKEKRKFTRKPILDTFSVYVVVPERGSHRLALHDLSEQGMSFDFDLEGESENGVSVEEGEQNEVHLYLNQSLYLSLQVKVIRAEGEGSVRTVGAEILTDSKGYKGYKAFLQMLDGISDTVELDA